MRATVRTLSTCFQAFSGVVSNFPVVEPAVFCFFVFCGRGCCLFCGMCTDSQQQQDTRRGPTMTSDFEVSLEDMSVFLLFYLYLELMRGV